MSAQFPAHLLHAMSQLGVREIPGSRHNPLIEAYHAATAAGTGPDELAWCSSFVNWCMLKAGIRGTRSKAAASWKTWGVGRPYIDGSSMVFELHVGDVCVFGKHDPDAKGTGHVFIAVIWDDVFVYGVGGNQSNTVSVVKRLRADMEAVRGVP